MPVMPDKAAFVSSAALYTALLGKPLFLPLQKQHLVAKNELAFSFRPKQKDQQLGGQYANDSCWPQHETAWDLF